MAVPPLLLAIFLLYLIGSSVTNLVALLVFFAWVGYARVVRAETMRLRSAPFVESAVVAGAGESRILIRHIFPQLLPVLVAIAVVEFAAIILAEAGLSFLGLGVQPPDSSWGRMVSDGQAFVTTGAWWLFAVPGAAIFVTVLLARLAAPWVQSLFGAEPETHR
jgi:peptide/nickel transport system permease protein